MDKSRQQFESLMKTRFPDADGYTHYVASLVWQASRESLEIELPEPFIANETWCYDEDLVNQVLIRNGVKIK